MALDGKLKTASGNGEKIRLSVVAGCLLTAFTALGAYVFKETNEDVKENARTMSENRVRISVLEASIGSINESLKEIKELLKKRS